MRIDRKRIAKARFKSVDERIVPTFGASSRAVLEAASAHAGIDLRDWTLEVGGSNKNGGVLGSKKRIVLDNGLKTLRPNVFRFVLLHELGHVRQYNDKTLEDSNVPLYARWKGRLTFALAVTPSAYAALPWERDASDFALASPFYQKVEPRDLEAMDGIDGTLVDTLREHIKMERTR